MDYKTSGVDIQKGRSFVEYIKTLTGEDWRKTKVDLHKRPAIFIIHSHVS